MKEKLKKLQAYLAHIDARLDSPTPPKHQDHNKQYREFLQREKQATISQIDSLKLEAK